MQGKSNIKESRDSKYKSVIGNYASCETALNKTRAEKPSMAKPSWREAE